MQVLLPVAFFVLMCLPKALVKPYDQALNLDQALPLNSPLWSNCYICGRGSVSDLLDGQCTMTVSIRIKRFSGSLATHFAPK